VVTNNDEIGVLTLVAPYWGITEIARVLAEAEEDGSLDFDFSLTIRARDPEKGRVHEGN